MFLQTIEKKIDVESSIIKYEVKVRHLYMPARDFQVQISKLSKKSTTTLKVLKNTRTKRIRRFKT